MTDPSEPELDPEAVRIGATIRALRIAYGLTLVELGDSIGVTNGYLSKIERGHKKPSGKLARGIAETLGVPLAAVVSPGYDHEADEAEAMAR